MGHLIPHISHMAKLREPRSLWKISSPIRYLPDPFPKKLDCFLNLIFLKIYIMSSDLKLSIWVLYIIDILYWV